ncbi:MAG: leucine-rich repeat domain-containing protein [Clostridia bacterium]|nr:leucine-rich repeat domain-containing protein [Clostridia bacterium]
MKATGKLISIILALLMLTGIVSVMGMTASAGGAGGDLDIHKSGTFTYSLIGKENNEAEICGVTDFSVSELEIPSSIDGHTVTSISGIDEDSRFSGCRRLQKVTLPNTLTFIGSDAFSGCASITEITIPKGVKRIRNSAFENCTALSSVTFNSDLEEIYFDAFKGCKALNKISLPDGIKDIGYDAFSDTGFSASAANWDGSVLYSGKYLLSTVQKNVTEEYTVKNGTTLIADRAFMGCTKLKKVDLGSAMKYVGDEAFYFCTGLTTVTIPASVVEIGAGAFIECRSLTDVNYGGTEEQRSKIDISIQNEKLTNATWHYSAAQSGGFNLASILNMLMSLFSSVTNNGNQNQNGTGSFDISALVTAAQAIIQLVSTLVSSMSK